MGYLRLLLALTVAVGHLQSGTLYGRPHDTIVFTGSIVAVKLFFIISGFYMALILDQRYTNAATEFYISRALRLLPIYFLAIILILLVAFVTGRPDFPPFLNLTKWSNLFDNPSNLWFAIPAAISNLIFLGQDASYHFCAEFDASHKLHLTPAAFVHCAQPTFLGINLVWIPPAWTLALECYFYLLAPYLCRRSLPVLGFIAALSFATNLVLIQSGYYQMPWFRTFFPAELYLFLLGVIAYRLRDRLPAPLSLLCTVTTVLAVLSYQHLPFLSWVEPGGYNFALFAIFALSIPCLFKIGNGLRGDEYLGDLSYPVYISHIATISYVVAGDIHFHVPFPVWIAANLVLIVMLAIFLRWLAQPIENIRIRYKRRILAPDASAAVSRGS